MNSQPIWGEKAVEPGVLTPLLFSFMCIRNVDCRAFMDMEKLLSKQINSKQSEYETPLAILTC